MRPLLKTTTLTLQRGDTHIVTGLNLSAGPGDVILLTGPNGSGKTSVLRALAGLLDQASGTVERDVDFHFLSAAELAGGTQIAGEYLSTQAALANQSFSLAYDPFDVASKLDVPLSRLSTGWRQRIKLTRLLLENRPLWLLDEPSDGLDAIGIQTLVFLLQKHTSAAGAAIIATHQPDIWPKGAQVQKMGAA